MDDFELVIASIEHLESALKCLQRLGVNGFSDYRVNICNLITDLENELEELEGE